MRRLLLGVVMAAGCGRAGFDLLVDATRVTDAQAAQPLGCSGTRGPIIDLADPRLVSYWSFNEGVIPAPDHGRANVPLNVLSGLPSVSPAGVAGSGLAGTLSVFGGSVYATSTELAAGTGDYTLEAWMYIDANQCGVTTKWVVAGMLGGLGCLIGGQALFQTSEGQVVGPNLEAAWHHVAGVRRGAALELWIDGALVNTQPIVPANITGTIGLDVGPLGALVDEIRVWHAALAPDEINRIARAALPGLIAYWTFDSDYAGFAAMGNDGTPFGGVQLATGRAGNGLSFAGTDGRVDATLADLAGDYTALAWFKTQPNGTFQSILDREPEMDMRSPVHLWVDDTTLTTNIRASDGSDFGGGVSLVLVDSCWHQAAVSRRGADLQAGEVHLYADGQSVADVTGTFGMTTDTTDPFRIGFRLFRDPRPFAGQIDEVQVYGRTLSAAEIAAIYAALQ